jgi:hypothetical protein
MCGPWRCFLGSSLGVEKCFQHFPAQGFPVGAARAQAEAVRNARRRLSLVRMCERALPRRDVHLGMDGWAGEQWMLGWGVEMLVCSRFVSYLRLVAMLAFERRWSCVGGVCCHRRVCQSTWVITLGVLVRHPANEAANWITLKPVASSRVPVSSHVCAFTEHVAFTCFSTRC